MEIHVEYRRAKGFGFRNAYPRQSEDEEGAERGRGGSEHRAKVPKPSLAASMVQHAGMIR